MSLEVSCSACGSRFALPDDLYERKVKGRIVTIQCRRCGAGIAVDASGPTPKFGEAAATTDAPPIATPDDGTPTVPLEGVRPSAAVKEESAPPARSGEPSEVWLVSYSDEDDRELTRAQLRDALARGEIDAETIVWKDGMADWLPIAEVAALGELLPQAKPAPLGVETPGPPAAAALARAEAPRPPPVAPKPAAEKPEPATEPKEPAEGQAARLATAQKSPPAPPAAPRPAAPSPDAEKPKTPPSPAAQPRPAPPAAAAAAREEEEEAPISLMPESLAPSEIAKLATPPAPPRPAPPPRDRKGPVALSAGTLILGSPAEKPAEDRPAPRRMPTPPSPPKPPLRPTPAEPPVHVEDDAAPESIGTPALSALMGPKKGQQEERADEDILGLGGGMAAAPLAPPTIDLSTLTAPLPAEESLPEVSAIELAPPSVDESKLEPLEGSPVSSKDPTRRKKKKKKRAEGAPDSLPAAAIEAPRPALETPKSTRAPVSKPAAAAPGAAEEPKQGGALVWLVAAAALAAGAWLLFGRGKSAETPEPPVATAARTATPQAEPTTKPQEPAAGPAATVATPAAQAPAEPAAAEKPAEKPAGEKPAGEKPVAEKPTGEKPTGERPAGEKPVAEKPTGEKPAEKPAEPPKPVELAGGFDKDAARAALAAAAGKASGCRQGSDPSGVAQVAITFAPSGRATSAVVQGKPFAGTATGGCIAAAMRSARVPPFSGDHVTVGKRVTIN